MKKIGVFLLVVALMASFAGCSRSNANKTTQPTTRPTTAPTTKPTTQPTTMPTIEPTLDTNIPDPDVDTSMPDDGVIPGTTDTTEHTTTEANRNRNMRLR